MAGTSRKRFIVLQEIMLGAAVKTNYQVCDHPELLTKDGLCHLCEQLEGQLDLLEEMPNDL